MLVHTYVRKVIYQPCLSNLGRQLNRHLWRFRIGRRVQEGKAWLELEPCVRGDERCSLPESRWCYLQSKAYVGEYLYRWRRYTDRPRVRPYERAAADIFRAVFCKVGGCKIVEMGDFSE